MKIIYTTIVLLFTIGYANAQILFEENFETGATTDWTIETEASDGGWLIGSDAQASSGYFPIPSNGSINFAYTNDDQCNCDKSNDLFISPSIDIDISGLAILQFDAVYLDNLYGGVQENATIEISTDGENYEVLLDLSGEAGWTTHKVNLAEYAGNSINIAFRYSDAGGWLYGLAIDNVTVLIPNMLDAKLENLLSTKFGEVDTNYPILGSIFNNGVNPITELEIGYSIDGSDFTNETISGLNIPSFESYDFQFENDWIPNSPGIYNLEIRIESVNNEVDEDATNNSLTIDSEIFDKVIVPNKMDEFLTTIPEIREVEGASGLLNSPTDLDFFPILGKNELWVINQRTENEGGSTVKISRATEIESSEYLRQVDGNAWHFMSLPTAIAFSSDNYNFASSPGVQDANHSGGTFTGPTLWSSDPEIYAQPSGGNGSHLDMLHGSPFGMGIAHEVDNVFWVYDDWNKDIVRYDFVEDHGPGADDHSDGIIRRFSDIGIDADGNIPNHMIVDKESGWLYFVDNGNDRVMRLEINSGTISLPLAELNEPLAEHSTIGNFTIETIITEGLDRPCGIEIFEGRLLVGDYATGDIIMYDMENGFAEMGRIPTNSEGLTGIKVGPDGNIWYTNRIQNSLMIASPSDVSSTNDISSQLKMNVSPNPTSEFINIDIKDLDKNNSVQMRLTNVLGQTLIVKNNVQLPIALDLSKIPNGEYFLSAEGKGFKSSQKITIQH